MTITVAHTRDQLGRVVESVFTYDPPCPCGLQRVYAPGLWNSADALQSACRGGRAVACLEYADGTCDFRGSLSRDPALTL